MKHLNTLKLLDMIFAVIILLAALAATVAIMLPAVGLIDAGETGAAVGMIVGGCVTFVLLLAFGILYWMTGKKVAQGRWRIMQTLLVLGSLFNFPLGTAYAVYALWVCWMNEETKAVFERGGLTEDEMY